MKHFLAGVNAFVDAAATALLGFAFFVLPLLFYSLVSLETPWTLGELAAFAAALWQLGHGLALRFSVSGQQLFELGVGSEDVSVLVSLPLALVLCLTVLLAARTGRRAASSVLNTQTRSFVRFVSQLFGAFFAFAVAAFVFGVFAAGVSTQPLWQQVITPVAWYAGGVCVGVLWRLRANIALWYEAAVLSRLHAKNRTLGQLAAAVACAPRQAIACVAGFVAVAAVAFLVAAVSNFTEFVRIYESLHPDFMGVVLLFVLQLLLLPVLLVWALAWLSGAGFVLGTETIYSPFTVVAGPVPALPVAALVPDGASGLPFIAPGVLLVTALVIGALFGRKVSTFNALQRFVLAACSGVLVGVFTIGVTAAARGAVGGGRLLVTGADALQVGLLLAGLATLGTVVGLYIPLGAQPLRSIKRVPYLVAKPSVADVADTDTAAEDNRAACKVSVPENSETAAVDAAAETMVLAREQTRPRWRAAKDAVAAALSRVHSLVKQKITRLDSKNSAVDAVADSEPETVPVQLDDRRQLDTAELLKQFEWQPLNSTLAEKVQHDLDATASEQGEA